MSNKQKTTETAKTETVVIASAEPKPQTSKPKKVPWNPWVGVLYATLVFFTAQFVAGLAVYMYPLIRGWGAERAGIWLSDSIVAQFWFVLLAEALTFWAIWWFIKRRGSNLRAIGWKRVRWADPMYAFMGFAIYFLCYAAVLFAATHLIPSLNVDQKQELGFNDVVGTFSLILTFLSLVVLPPIVEETVFRGFVYTGIRNKFKPVIAAIITSLLFAVAHLQFGNGKPLLWVAALDTFTLSMVLCYLRQKTDSLWPGILLHALKNCIAFITLYLLHVQ